MIGGLVHLYIHANIRTETLNWTILAPLVDIGDWTSPSAIACNENEEKVEKSFGNFA